MENATIIHIKTTEYKQKGKKDENNKAFIQYNRAKRNPFCLLNKEKRCPLYIDYIDLVEKITKNKHVFWVKFQQISKFVVVFCVFGNLSI